MKFSIMKKAEFKTVLIWLTMLAKEVKRNEKIRHQSHESEQKSAIGYRRVLSWYRNIRHYRRFRQYIARGGENVDQSKQSAYANKAIGIYYKAKA